MEKIFKRIKLQPQIIAIMFMAITFAFVTLPKVFANTINVTREITAPVDKVWIILSKRDSIKFYQFLA